MHTNSKKKFTISMASLVMQLAGREETRVHSN